MMNRDLRTFARNAKELGEPVNVIELEYSVSRRRVAQLAHRSVKQVRKARAMSHA